MVETLGSGVARQHAVVDAGLVADLKLKGRGKRHRQGRQCGRRMCCAGAWSDPGWDGGELFVGFVTNHAAHCSTGTGAQHTATQQIARHAADHRAGGRIFFLSRHALAATQAKGSHQ